MQSLEPPKVHVVSSHVVSSGDVALFSQPLGRLVVLLASPYPWLAPAVIMLSSVYIIM